MILEPDLAYDPAAEFVYPSKLNFYAFFMIRRMYIYQVAYQNVAANILKYLISY